METKAKQCMILPLINVVLKYKGYNRYYFARKLPTGFIEDAVLCDHLVSTVDN
jgi:hypothetical protein